MRQKFWITAGLVLALVLSTTPQSSAATGQKQNREFLDQAAMAGRTLSPPTGDLETSESAAQRDLAAQEAMARSAEAQLKEVRAQTITLWFGIIFSAAASAIAGLALLVAMGTGRRQLRAYVMPDSILMLHPTFNENYAKVRPKPLDQPGVIIALKNSGPTPATKALHWAQCEIHPIQYESTLKTPKNLDRVSESAVAPGGVITKTLFLTQPLTATQAQDIRDHRTAIYVHGVVTYFDAFKRKRTTRFRLRYSGVWPPTRGASFTFCDDGNHVD